MLTEKVGKTKWLIDSGATNHICSDLNLFQNRKPVVGANEYITVPNGRKIPIANIGSVRVNNSLVLHNVLHIPHIQFNLISVQRLCKDMNSSVIFNGQDCLLQDHLQKGSPLLLGKFQEVFTVHQGLMKLIQVFCQNQHFSVLKMT